MDNKTIYSSLAKVLTFTISGVFLISLISCQSNNTNKLLGNTFEIIDNKGTDLGSDQKIFFSNDGIRVTTYSSSNSQKTHGKWEWYVIKDAEKQIWVTFPKGEKYSEYLSGIYQIAENDDGRYVSEIVHLSSGIIFSNM